MDAIFGAIVLVTGGAQKRCTHRVALPVADNILKSFYVKYIHLKMLPARGRTILQVRNFFNLSQCCAPWSNNVCLPVMFRVCLQVSHYIAQPSRGIVDGNWSYGSTSCRPAIAPHNPMLLNATDETNT